MRLTWGLVAAVIVGGSLRAETPAERGEKALLRRHFTPPSIPLHAYQNVWKIWDDKATAPPDDYHRAVRDRYGLHTAPYPNGGYPMGLRPASGLLGKGLSIDCLACHGGSVHGQSYVGLGNATLDFQALYEEMAAAAGLSGRSPHVFCNVRGTSEAGAMSVFLLGWREPDLTLRTSRLELDLHDDMCEDVPAWWLFHKKKTMYWTGGAETASVRSLMQFMMSPLNGPTAIKKEEATFADVREYLRSLRPPRYPLAVDAGLARKGEAIFGETCARCHGTYGEKWTYPNKVVPVADIGTDPKRYHGITAKFGDYFNKSWFAEHSPGAPSVGYQAPPLDGIWASAPYFHNGSAPTVYHVLNSKARPRIFTRSYRTDRDAHDEVKLGWKVQELARGPDPALPAIERRKVYDTTQPGRSNGGHTYGDRLTDAERMAVIEYLKTL